MWIKSLKWGVLLGLALSFLELVRMFARIYEYPSTVFDLVQIILFIALIFLAQKDYKENPNGGYLSFAKAYGIGTIVTVVAILIYMCYLIFHFSVIETLPLQRVFDGKITNALAAAMLFSLFPLLCGLFLNLFTAMYLYKRKDDK
ncbi:MAG: DUF4199 domain-containing protein [Bacteroidales bacterium]|nr:DUF4199 domain-containing protein [Bacteroidales bacterium]